MSRSVLWDSSAVIALIDRDDANHVAALEVATLIAGERRPCFMTNYAQAETHAMLLRRLGRSIAREWLFAGGLPVIPAAPADEERARAILLSHQDKDWSYCDAVSFAVMDGRRVTTAFSFDRHFAQYGRFVVLGLK